MAQYKTGSVSVTNGSAVVTGTGTLWVGEVAVGDIFTIVGSNAWYEVGAVNSNTSITLTANYAGATITDSTYAISRDFTANYGLPYPQKGDIETASLIKRAFQDIDSKLVLTNSDGDVTITGDLIVAGSTISLDNATVQTFTWGDNDKAIFGDGSDLQIYHDGTTSKIDGAVTLTSNVTLGDASTDTVTVNGYMGVRATPAPYYGIVLGNSSAITGDANPRGISSSAVYGSDATGLAAALFGQVRTTAAAYTMANAVGARLGDASKGAGSTITNQHGVYIEDQTQGTNNYGITSLVSSGTNKWNIYASGTAANYFAGNVGIGTSSPQASAKLHVYAAGDYTDESAPFTVGSSTTGDMRLYAGVNNTSDYTYIGSVRSGQAYGSLVLQPNGGNLGLGVTPSGWNSSAKALQLNTTGSFWGVGGQSRVGNNHYFDSGSTFRYLTTGAIATDFSQTSSGFFWNIAPSGTAGDPITFTQALSVGHGTSLALQGATSQSGTGITFPATQNASSNANTLDDYEEGTWTPTVNLLGTITYGQQTGYYQKVGNRVTVGYAIVCSSTNTTQDTAQAQITGLPFTAGATAYANGATNVISEGLAGTSYASSQHTFWVFPENGYTYLNIFENVYNGPLSNRTWYGGTTRQGYVGGTWYLYGELSYIAS